MQADLEVCGWKAAPEREGVARRASRTGVSAKSPAGGLRSAEVYDVTVLVDGDEAELGASGVDAAPGRGGPEFEVHGQLVVSRDLLGGVLDRLVDVIGVEEGLGDAAGALDGESHAVSFCSRVAISASCGAWCSRRADAVGMPVESS